MWLGLAAVEVCPSPNVQLYVNGCPSGSLDPALEKFAVSGAGPDVGLAAADAIGGLVARDEADPAKLAHAEGAADVRVPQVQVIERPFGTLDQVDDVAVGAVGTTVQRARS